MVGYQDSTTVDEVITTGNLTTPDTKREFHNDETSTYWLPKDDEEQMRLTGVQTDYSWRKITKYICTATLCYQGLIWRVTLPVYVY